jgi:chromatin segregation and condensation protein Rec8/ScpA/Scc1 (kleisin family)
VRIGVKSFNWESLIFFGDVSISVLCEVVEGKFRLDNNEIRNNNYQIKALTVINTILQDITKKVNTLSPYLEHDNDNLRQKTANLLEPHQSEIKDPKYAKLIKALLFNLYVYLTKKSEISSLAEGEEELRKAKETTDLVEKTFNPAINVCTSEKTKNFLVEQKNLCIKDIETYKHSIRKLRKDITINELNRNVNSLMKFFNISIAVTIFALIVLVLWRPDNLFVISPVVSSQRGHLIYVLLQIDLFLVFLGFLFFGFSSFLNDDTSVKFISIKFISIISSWVTKIILTFVCIRLNYLFTISSPFLFFYIIFTTIFVVFGFLLLKLKKQINNL